MLNELRELSLCLEKAGIEVEDLHPNFKACPKGGITYWVYLDENGDIVGVAPVPSTQVPRIRKWEKANGISFPAFNVPPLLEADSDNLKEQVKGLRRKIEQGNNVPTEEVSALVAASKNLWGNGITRKLTDCLTKPITDISECIGMAAGKYESIGILSQRAALIKAETFRQQLTVIITQNLHDTPVTDLIDIREP